MTNNPDLVMAIYGIAAVVFIGGVVLAFVSTVSRVLYYHRNKAERPALLTRDVIVKGGYAISFGLIAAIRLVPADIRASLNLGGNVLWALVTSVPACVSVIVYLYYELAVIERGRM